MEEIVGRVSRHLGLIEKPQDLWLWNGNYAPSGWGVEPMNAFNMVKDIRPVLAIVDPLTSINAEIEEKNSIATNHYKEWRKVIKETGVTVCGIHHLRKHQGQEAPPALSDCSLRQWFLQARGARALINGCDVRVGLDSPRRSRIITNPNGRKRRRLPLSFAASDVCAAKSARYISLASSMRMATR